MIMANLCSLLSFNCRYLKLCRRGILAFPNEIQKLSCRVPNLKCNPCLASLIKYSSTYSRKFEPVSQIQNLQFSNKIEDLKLSQLLREKKLNEGLIINTFLKFIRAYYSYKGQRGIEEKLNSYLESPNFIQFFELIDRELNKFSASSLLTLYELEILKTPRTDALLQKVFNLLGENLMTYSFFERLNVYISTVQKFPSKSECKSIIEICEDYFNKSMEDDLEYEKFSQKLICLLEAKELPLFVSKMIAQKLADKVIDMFCDKRSVGYFIAVVGNNPHLLNKKTLIKLIRVTVEFLPQSVALKSVCQIYSDLVLYDESFYSQDIVNLMMEAALRSEKQKLTSVAVFILRLGYLDDNFVKAVIECALERTRVRRVWYEMLNVANIFTHVSANETMPESMLEEFRECFQEYDFINSAKFSMSKSKAGKPVLDFYCAWITYLTYFGCDTRELLNDFFSRAKTNLIHLKSLRKTLLLHHLAKAYFPSGYETLGAAVLEKLISLEFREVKSLNLDECFDKDCLLRNCVNSNQHFFHFLALLGPDNKPINLSMYKEKQLALPSKRYLNICDIKKPPGSKLIAFQENPFPYANEFRNVPKKCGFYKIYKKAFEHSGCEIVVLPSYFFHLKLEEKKEFLNKQINEVLGVSDNSR